MTVLSPRRPGESTARLLGGELVVEGQPSRGEAPDLPFELRGVVVGGTEEVVSRGRPALREIGKSEAEAKDFGVTI